MKYVIQSCSSRLWYVQNFLVPDMLSQGINESDICVLNDDDSLGCLWHWIRVCEIISCAFRSEPGVWYLQDDVLISNAFKEATEAAPRNMVCNGFVARGELSKTKRQIGIVPAKELWYSFQCFYTPIDIVNGFSKWFRLIYAEGRYREYIAQGKFADYMFRLYLLSEHSGENIFNMFPNIVQHVDYLINGSMVNKDRAEGRWKAFYWTEDQLEKELAEKIRRWKNDRE